MRLAATSTILVLLFTGPVLAQDQKPTDPTPPETAPPTQPLSPNNPESPTNPSRPIWQIAKDIGTDFVRLPSVDSALVMGLGGAAALLAHPVDPDVNGHLRADGWESDVFEPGKVIGYGATQVALGAGTYFVGKLIDGPRTVHIGVDLLRAQIVTGALTYGLKAVAHRQRPDGSDGYSFPSGHASVTFATATVLARHFGWRGILTYAASGYVAASRLKENRHYLSDVIFGAAVGTMAGRTVTRHGRDVWTFAPAPVNRGVGFVVIRNPR